MQQFFYDQQIRRFLIQFTRIFSNFQVEYGGTVGAPDASLVRVPVRYGDATRQAQTIIQENSANSMPSTPLITFYISALDYDRPRMQEPYHISNVQVRQRFYNTDTEAYETTQGNAFTIERLMPVPYKLTINCDIWTSNTNQKFQLFEQISTLFNPSLEIQSTDNYIDWTSLSIVELEQVTWTSRSLPIGTENPIDIMTMRFILPIWISPPAKVKKLGVIENIIASVFNAQGDAREAIADNDLLSGTRQKITPYNYQTLLIGNKVGSDVIYKLQALKYSTVVDQPNSSITVSDSPPSNEFWHSIVGLYGKLRPGISQIRLEYPWDENVEIIGTISYDPSDDRFMFFTPDVDTLPQNTLVPVNAVINPLLSGPGSGLPVAADGQRYLILDDLGDPNYGSFPPAWGEVVASANDIIQFDGVNWGVAFDSSQSTNIQYTTNITTGLQYRWTGSNTGNEWVKSFEGLYTAGTWSIVL